MGTSHAPCKNAGARDDEATMPDSDPAAPRRETPPATANDNAKPLAPAARRALEEAAARRAAEEAAAAARPHEIAGRGGLEPVRYGDWEIKGIAADF